MKAILGYQDVWDLVQNGLIPLPENANAAQQTVYRESKKKDWKGLCILHQCVNPAIFEKIARSETSKEAWDILANSYAGDQKLKKVRLQTLRRQYELLGMEESESIAAYFTRVQTMTNQMLYCGETLFDESIVEKILRSVSSRFDHITVAIEQAKDLSTMTIEELQGSLEAHEQRMNEKKTVKPSTEQALAAQTGNKSGGNQRGRGRGRNNYRGGKGRGNYNNSNSAKVNSSENSSNNEQGNNHTENYRGRGGRGFRGRGRKFDKSYIQCYNCGRYGHFADECYSNVNGNDAKMAEEEEETEETLLMAIEEKKSSDETVQMVSIKKEGENGEYWVLDTGCSTHMTGRREWFVELDFTIKSRVRFADDRTMKVEGVGKVMIRKKDGSLCYITGVLYVPGMKSNLLSIGQLLEKGYRMVLEDKAMKVYDTEHNLLMKGILSNNRIFKIELGMLLQQCLATAVDKEEWLWHFRYGHLNFGDLNRMQSKAIVKGLPHIHVPKDVCAECMESKMSRGAFNPNVPSRSKRKLQVIFSDVCGPIQHETPAGNKYFVTFIDDFTRKLWIYLIKRKNEVLGVFKKFKVLVEKQSGQNIEILRTDGGGEYVSTEFDDYCENEGITHEVTPPYTPQHNGVAERKNRTLLNMVRSMLKSKNMPKMWWGEAVNTAAYIINRSPTKKMENITPEEAWTGVKPNVSHFRVFGSVCYRHVPDQLRTKLDDKGEVMIMVGYHSTGGYKLVNPVNNKIVISRDIVFDEGNAWKWSEKGESSTGVEQNLFDVPAGETESDIEGETGPVEDNDDEGGSPEMPRRSLRQRQVPARLNDYEIMPDGAIDDEGDLVHFALLAETEPVTLQEAMKNSKWLEAMKEELRSIEKNLTWELVELPKGKKAIGVKWVYKVKVNPKGEVVKYKARLVARGFLQRHGVDYEEVFAPVARIETVRVVVAHASMQRWKVHQLDVKSAFLNGELEEEVYVEQPAGFVKQGSEKKVLKLRKALYGLKQAPRAWNKKIDKSLINMGYVRCISEHGVYVKSGGGDIVILCLYVDDLLVTGNNETKVIEFKRKMMSTFEMTDLGEISYFLGIEFQNTSDGVLLSQKKYASDVLKRFNMQHCNGAATPAEAGLWLDKNVDEPEVDATKFRQVVGALRYLCNTRPDIAFSVGLISRVMDRPRTSHLAAAKRILRYVKDTMAYGILLPSKCRENEKGLYGFTDADWGGDKTDRKSTAGSVFLLGSGPISWSSKKESVVALSSCEAEYIAASMGACQAIWLDNLMQELMIKKESVVELFVDNKSAISLAKHPIALKLQQSKP